MINPLRRWNNDWRSVTPITPDTASTLRRRTSEPILVISTLVDHGVAQAAVAVAGQQRGHRQATQRRSAPERSANSTQQDIHEQHGDAALR